MPMEHVTGKWTVLALDMRTLLEQDTGSPFKYTKNIQFCGNLRARGAFTSDNKCDAVYMLPQGPTSSRRDCVATHLCCHTPRARPCVGTRWRLCRAKWCSAQRSTHQSSTSCGCRTSQRHRRTFPALRTATCRSCSMVLSSPPLGRVSALRAQSSQETLCPRGRCPQSVTTAAHTLHGAPCVLLCCVSPKRDYPLSYPPRCASCLPVLCATLPRWVWATLETIDGRELVYRAQSPTPRPRTAAAVPTQPSSILDSGPCLALERVNGFTGEYTNAMMPAPSAKEVFFIAANNLIAMDMQTQRQRFFQGHTDNITAFALSGAF